MTIINQPKNKRFIAHLFIRKTSVFIIKFCIYLQGTLMHLLILARTPFNFSPIVDRDQTVSRRFKPSSRTTLNGEQPYPWDRLQPQDVMSRHRGAKLPRRYELLGGISLLSPEYLLSDERWPFHMEPPDHYTLLSYLVDLSVSQSSTLMLLHSTHGYQAC